MSGLLWKGDLPQEITETHVVADIRCHLNTSSHLYFRIPTIRWTIDPHITLTRRSHARTRKGWTSGFVRSSTFSLSLSLSLSSFSIPKIWLTSSVRSSTSLLLSSPPPSRDTLSFLRQLTCHYSLRSRLLDLLPAQAATRHASPHPPRRFQQSPLTRYPSQSPSPCRSSRAAPPHYLYNDGGSGDDADSDGLGAADGAGGFCSFDN